MNGYTPFFTDGIVQCWSCPVFDSLIGIISSAAAAIYDKLALLSAVLLGVFVAFYVLYSVVMNMKNPVDKIDPMYQKYLKPVFINSMFVIAILGMGVMIPRFITQITFEPVADATIVYTENILNASQVVVDERVPYLEQTMSEDGFYRPELRDKIIRLMRTSITQFQNMIKLGMIVIDRSFSWSAVAGIGNLVKHFLLLMVGLAIVWIFFKLFIKFCFYFVDVVIDLTFFAFFFPFMLVLWVFRNSESVSWVKDMSKNMTPTYFKNAINSIVSLGVVVITYVVIMVVIIKFLASPEINNAELTRQIMNGTIFDGSFSDDNIAMVSLGGVIVLSYIVMYMADNIGQVAKAISETFGIEVRTKESDKIGEQVIGVGKYIKDDIKKRIDILRDKKPSDDKKDDKKEDKK
ncbi:MAG: hypothetical protein LBL75_01090 [Rickettsiales bacterium]|jgi:hypothetical protein|nr:hypothetical protein [Rickettsiales bacterium]